MMRRQLFTMGLIIGLATLIQLGCNGTTGVGTGSTSSQQALQPPSGSVVLVGRDAPICSVLSFTVTITGATLTPQGGGNPVPVISSDNPVTLDFAALLDFATVLNVAKVPTGTYSKLTLTLSNPQIIIYDTTKSPPGPSPITTTPTTLNLTVDINPPLTVPTNGTVGLNVDFSLLKSVQTDATGQVTGTVTPVFTVSPTTVSIEGGLAEVDDLRGIVKSVTTSSTNTAFTGSFTVLTLSGSTFTVNVTSQTEFDGVSGLSGLSAGTFVEVEGFVDANANLVAREVEAEEKGDASQQRAAFVGLVSSVTRDSNGNATQFTMYVREEHPDMSSSVPPKSSLAVNLSSATRLVITAEDTNRADLKFDATTLGVGQEVVAHGQLQTGTPPTLNASAVFLRLQSILGNLSLLPTTPVIKSSVDGKTGGFTLIPCSPVLQGQPVTVLTFNQTAFAGITDLNGLTSSEPRLIVKGLVFYQQNQGSVNNVSWLPPVTVEVAKQVHQLQ